MKAMKREEDKRGEEGGLGGGRTKGREGGGEE